MAGDNLVFHIVSSYSGRMTNNVILAIKKPVIYTMHLYRL